MEVEVSSDSWVFCGDLRGLCKKVRRCGGQFRYVANPLAQLMKICAASAARQRCPRVRWQSTYCPETYQWDRWPPRSYVWSEQVRHLGLHLGSHAHAVCWNLRALRDPGSCASHASTPHEHRMLLQDRHLWLFLVGDHAIESQPARSPVAYRIKP